MLFLKGLVDLHRIVQLQFLQHYWLGLDHHDIEWFSLEMNRDHSVVFEIASKYCISAEKAMAPHSSTLAWKIPCTEELGRLQSMGSLKVGHD